MRKVSLLRLLSVVICLGFIATSCEKQPGEQVDDSTVNKALFDFATVGNYKFEVDYKLPFDVPVVFYVYDEYPFKPSDGSSIAELKDGLKPISKDITSDYGKYSGMLSIKKSVKELYVYSTSIGAVQLLKTKFQDNAIVINANDPANFADDASITTKSASLVQGDSFLGCLTLGSWNPNGQPSYLIHPAMKIKKELIQELESSLQEGESVPVKHPEFIKDGANTSIKITKPTEVSLVFIHEMTEYKNCLGYFHYPTNNPPKSKEEIITKIIAFPNVSTAGSGGVLSRGDMVKLKYWDGKAFQDKFPAGTSIGWFLIADGFNSTKKLTNLNTFYSFNDFNPEIDATNRAHTVLLHSKSQNLIILGFEDMLRVGRQKSENDFNDVLFCIKAEVDGAIDYENIPPTILPKDSDGDGVLDDDDEFPEDPELAYTKHYPAEYTNYTLAFEDMWPRRGDYDMNDVMVTYNSTHFLNSKSKVVKVTDRWAPTWSGGKYNVGFGYQMGVPSSSVKEISRNIYGFGNFTNNYQTNANGTEAGQEKATITVFDNILDFKSTVGGLPLNSTTTKSANVAIIRTIEITTKFSNPQGTADITLPPYNPFIIINGNAQDKVGQRNEVHLPNYCPTDLANKNILGTLNDKSEVQKGRYYISDDNMPFAIIVPDNNFTVPTEYISIAKQYPKFSNWVKSGGQTDKDWYFYKN